MSNAEKIKELVNAFKSLEEKDQERLVYIAEGMRIAQGNSPANHTLDHSPA